MAKPITAKAKKSAPLNYIKREMTGKRAKEMRKSRQIYNEELKDLKDLKLS